MLDAAEDNVAIQLQETDIARALRHTNLCINDGTLGAGCMDLSQAASFIKSMNLSK